MGMGLEARRYGVEEAHPQEGGVIVVAVAQLVLGQLAEQAGDILLHVEEAREP